MQKQVPSRAVNARNVYMAKVCRHAVDHRQE
jgi:hypothetical protein